MPKRYGKPKSPPLVLLAQRLEVSHRKTINFRILHEHQRMLSGNVRCLLNGRGPYSIGVLLNFER
jgi:hypothetical protein